MRRSYDYEFKHESHSLHEQRCSWSTTNYPSYEQKKYYVPPPTNTMMVHNKPPFHYEPSDDENEHDHDHIEAINDVYDNRRWVHHGHDDGNHGWCGTNHAISHQENAKNKHREPMLRPPSHQYRHPTVIDQGKQVENQDSWRYGEASRVNYNRNRAMEDYPRKYIHNYGEDSREEDDYGNAGIGDHLKSLIKGLNGKVKKIEVIEYERTRYRGASREEWRMVGGNDAPTNYPTNNHFYGNYPKSNAPRVKGF